MDLVIAKIKVLRDKGFSIKAIASELNISENTVRQFLTPDQFSKRAVSYMDTFYRRRVAFMNLDIVNIGNLSEESCRLYASLLYWCEGSKYPSSTVMSFTTSDPDMAELFLLLIRKGFNIREEKLRIWLQIHTDQNPDFIFSFWSKKLGIPTCQFFKPHITTKRGGKYRRVYNGTCSIKYGDYSIILRLMGIYKRFFEQAIEANI